jgi:hypothetical protein
MAAIVKVAAVEGAAPTLALDAMHLHQPVLLAMVTIGLEALRTTRGTRRTKAAIIATFAAFSDLYLD